MQVYSILNKTLNKVTLKIWKQVMTLKNDDKTDIESIIETSSY